MTEQADRASSTAPGIRSRVAVGLSALVFALGAGGAIGCGDDDEGPAEEAGQAADDAGEEAGEAIEDADDEIGEDEE